jgi:myosin heavy subunit
MLKNWFLITAASFGVGFGVSYIYLHSPKESVIAGAAGTTGAISSVLLCSKQRKEELERQAQSRQVTVNILEQQEKTLGQQLQSHQDNRQTIQYQVEQLEQQLAGLQSKQQGQEASIAKFDRELETKRNSMTELDDKRVELTTLTAEIASLQQQQNAAQAALLDLQNIETEITIYSATKAQLVLEIARLDKYQAEIKIQIADDKDTCERTEEYLLFVDQEVHDKQSDLLELDINIKSKVTELNICRQQLAELSQQKTEAESAIKKLAIELQKAGEAILQQENIQHAAEAQSAQLASDISSLKLELLDRHSQMTDLSLQYVDVPQQSLGIEQIVVPVALPVPSVVESLQPQESLSEPEQVDFQLVDMQFEESLLDIEETNFQLVDIQPETLFSVAEESSLDFMDYLDSMDSLPDLAEFSLQFTNYLPTADSQSFSELVEPNLELVEASLPELAKPTVQFVEFQPVELSMFDLEETSPILTSAFSDLCEMDLIDISADPLELGLLDITDLDEMTLEQDSLDALNISTLDLNDITLDQEPLNPLKAMASNLPADFDWSENFIDNPYLAVLWHIDQHGSIEHFEVAALLNDKKLAKQFAAKLPEYAELMPFAIDIEATKTGNRYQKRALVLVEA